MCDYSLYAIPNRLARDGEELVLYRFESGTIGFASVCDLREVRIQPRSDGKSLWAAVKTLLSPRRCPGLPAICMPPGSRLLLTDVPKQVQTRLCIEESEIAIFTELSSKSYSYRDALLLPNGTRVLLQDLPEGIQATVLSTSPGPVEIHEGVHAHAA